MFLLIVEFFKLKWLLSHLRFRDAEERNFGVRYFCHRSKRHCCHLLMVHRWCCTEEPGKLKRGICEREECKNKHSACLRCYLYFFGFVFFSSSDCVSYMGRTQASLSFPALTFMPICTTSKYISRTALALSHPPLKVHIAHTHAVYNWEKKQGLHCCQPWLFLCVHEVPALRSFQSCWVWKIMLFIWMSAPRTHLARVRRQAVLLKKEGSVSCGSLCLLCVWQKGEWGV